jgi:hypothetical protein
MVLLATLLTSHEPAPLTWSVGVWREQPLSLDGISAVLFGATERELALERRMGGEWALAAEHQQTVNTDLSTGLELPGTGQLHVRVLSLDEESAELGLLLQRGPGLQTEWKVTVPRGRDVVAGGYNDLLLTVGARW